MFQVGDKIRVNSIPYVITAEAVNAIRKVSLEAAKEMSRELNGFDIAFINKIDTIYNLVTQVQTINEIFGEDRAYVVIGNFYVKHSDIEKVKPVDKRISIKELREIL